MTALFQIAYDVAIRRADVCEHCGKAPVSKALRIMDPVWGAFDTPSNLLAVCLLQRWAQRAGRQLKLAALPQEDKPAIQARRRVRWVQGRGE